MHIHTCILKQQVTPRTNTSVYMCIHLRICTRTLVYIQLCTHTIVVSLCALQLRAHWLYFKVLRSVLDLLTAVRTRHIPEMSMHTCNAAIDCNTLQYTAAHYNTLQHSATDRNKLPHTSHTSWVPRATLPDPHNRAHRWKISMHTPHAATHCNKLQHAAIYYCQVLGSASDSS